MRKSFRCVNPQIRYARDSTLNMRFPKTNLNPTTPIDTFRHIILSNQGQVGLAGLNVIQNASTNEIFKLIAHRQTDKLLLSRVSQSGDDRDWGDGYLSAARSIIRETYSSAGL